MNTLGLEIHLTISESDINFIYRIYANKTEDLISERKFNSRILSHSN